MKIVNPTGRLGEDLARSYLRKQGYHILETNFRKGYGELDIICLDPTKTILVFVEVKTRKSTQFGTAFEAITSWKLDVIIRTAQYYKLMHPALPDALRIDAVAILLNTNNSVQTIEHLKNITL